MVLGTHEPPNSELAPAHEQHVGCGTFAANAAAKVKAAASKPLPPAKRARADSAHGSASGAAKKTHAAAATSAAAAMHSIIAEGVKAEIDALKSSGVTGAELNKGIQKIFARARENLNEMTT